MSDRYAPDAGPVDLAAAMQGHLQKLALDRNHHLITPRLFPVQVAVKRQYSNLLKDWGELTVRIQNEKRRGQ